MHSVTAAWDPPGEDVGYISTDTCKYVPSLNVYYMYIGYSTNAIHFHLFVVQGLTICGMYMYVGYTTYLGRYTT